MKTGILRAVIIIATAFQLLISTAQANPVKITVTPPPSGDSSGTGAGKMQVSFVSDGTGNMGELTGLPINVNAGASASTTASNAAATVNNFSGATGEVATVKREGNGAWSVTIAPTTVNGTTGSDFTGVKITVPQGGTAPANLLFNVKVMAASPGDAQLQLVSQATPNPYLNINWTLNVDDQNDNVLATSSLTAVPDTTDAATLIGMFDTSLLSQDIPVVADGDTLSLTTANNDYFFLTESATGSLYPLLSDSLIVPEPASVWLVVIGMPLLLRRMRQRK